MKPPVLAITIGDVNGIAPEVTLKSLANPLIRSQADFFLVGSLEIYQQIHSQLRLGLSFRKIGSFSEHRRDVTTIDVLDIAEASFPIRYGETTAEAGRLAGKSIVTATLLCMSHQIDGLITAPLSKKGLHLGGFLFPGQTEFLSELAQQPSVMMMLVAEKMRIGLVTTHLPLKAISPTITGPLITEKLNILSSTLRTRFHIPDPKIAVTGLNPHAGENGVIGDEEIDVIAPAIASAIGRGIKAEGPFPADTLFRNASHYDAILAMYHDQGLIPIKTLYFDTAVNFTAGLPFIRTSPDHGTAYDIAGKNQANPKAMESALTLATSLSQNAG